MTKEQEPNRCIAILAYGSLISHPGEEIKQHKEDFEICCYTPFHVEYARKSSSRGNAPTLIPVVQGGSHVKAKLLILKKNVSLQQAKDMLFRREIHQVGKGIFYKALPKPNINTVIIEQLENFHNIDIVIYTKIGANIDNPTPQLLAKLAIESVKQYKDKDETGIRYLSDNINKGIITPLTAEYKKKILEIGNAESLESVQEKLLENETK